MRTIGAALVVIGALCACSPGDTRKVEPAAAEAAKPSQAALETFGANCAWGEVKGAALSMWSYACGPDFGSVRLVADDALPGFALESAGVDGQPERRTVVRIFDKPAEAGIDAILPTVRAASPGLATSSCVLEPAPGRDGLYLLAPTGPIRAAYDAENFSDTVPAMPCGDLGVGPAGDRVFKVMEGHPDKVAYIDYGSEIQIFDAATLKVAAGDGH